MPYNLLITGESGIGKSTALSQSVEFLSKRRIAGFLSPRVVTDGSDPGWRIEGFNGVSGMFAHASIRGRHRMGLLGVDIDLFERCISSETSALSRSDLVIIDEIGIIGGWSEAFRQFAERALDSTVPTVAIVRQKSGDFSDRVKSRDDVEIWTLNREIRDVMPGDIARWVEATDLPMA